MIRFAYVDALDAFELTVDGLASRPIPALSGEDLKSWFVRYARVWAHLESGAKAATSIKDLLKINDLAEQDLVDALIAYDRTGALESRRWLEETLTMEQVVLMLTTIVGAHA